MTTWARSRQPGWVVGRILLSMWIVVTALRLITAANGRPYFIVVGIFSITVVAALAVRLVIQLVRASGTATGSSRPTARFRTITPPRSETTIDRLRRHDPTVADQVQVALDLLTGPLVGVLGRDDTHRTHRAIESAVTEYSTVDDAIDRTVAAHHALSTTLGGDMDTPQDPDARQLVQHEADLRRRQAEIVDRLQQAATGLRSAWEPVRDQQILRLRHGQLSRARDNAEAVAAQVIPGADASTGLADAIEKIQGSLGGIREVGRINDRILGDDGSLGPRGSPSEAVDGGQR